VRNPALAACLIGASLAAAPAAVAQLGLPEVLPPLPIPQGPGAEELPEFTGSPATPQRVRSPRPPRHPFMAPNGDSNIHDDAYMTDAYTRPGPLGRDVQRVSTLQSADCASHTFDSRGRLITVCVGLEGPRLVMFDPNTLDQLAVFSLPPRVPGAGNPFTDFSGGGYFYLDHRDRAVIPTTTREIFVVRQTAAGDGFELERTYTTSAVVAPGDSIVSALPDFKGRIWFVSSRGVVGFVRPRSGGIESVRLEGEGISNSFSVDKAGGVYIVSDRALYRFGVRGGRPAVRWREGYQNTGQQKPGQVDDGSGTTPTVMGRRHVAITDNADPMNVVVMRRGLRVRGNRVVCSQPVFGAGQSATDNSLIVARRSLVVENNYGYTGPASTEGGRSTAPGVERVDLDRDGQGCRRVWHSDEHSPTVVPKLSLATGLVYLYTKPPRTDGQDAWYFTAIDFRTGRTVYSRLAGEGFGYNNNYAPISLGPTGNAYVGVLGGLVLFRDAQPPSTPVRLRLRLRCAGSRTRATVRGQDRERVREVVFRVKGRRVTRDRKEPFRKTVHRAHGRPAHRHRVVTRSRIEDGRVVRLTRRFRSCPRT
jgi:hypothetical protein